MDVSSEQEGFYKMNGWSSWLISWRGEVRCN